MVKFKNPEQGNPGVKGGCGNHPSDCVVNKQAGPSPVLQAEITVLVHQDFPTWMQFWLYDFYAGK